jgi:myosin heavy subunit
MLQEIQLDARPHTTDYKYLCMGSGREAKDLKDAENFQEMFDAFLDMGFNPENVLEIFRVVGSVLTLGNVNFKEIDQGEASVIDEDDAESDRCYTSVASSLGIDKVMLGMALCTRTFQSGGLRKSVTTVRLNPQKAIETRDSLARNLYDKLFKDIIVQINENAKANNVETSNRLIGLLDIFGFEIFEHNSFEQLCINYCNEMLQNHFNFVIFIAETNLYEEENIHCDTITFKPNDGVISKIEEAFKSLDEESRIPRGSSKTWFEKMKKGGQGTPKGDEVVMTFPVKHDNFIVNHYAGPVTYLPENFMEKNTETLSNDLVGVMIGSSSELISRLFSDPEEAGDGDGDGGSPTTGSGGRRKSSVRSQVPSLSKNFQFQLTCLMNMLRTTESHFVRCIKSSAKCMPQDFDAPLIHRQLLYSGVFEVVKIQQSGLPFRLKHADFNERYRCLIPLANRWTGNGSVQEEAKSVVENLKELYASSLHQLQLGRTMTFMKGKEFRFLESEKEYAESEAANAMKKWCRAARIFKVFKQVL